MGDGNGVIAVGIDLVDVSRVEQLLGRYPERFAERVFTAQEAAYCRRGVRAGERFAARFAAKEAAMKALGTGWDAGVTFRDVEVVRAASGAPGIRLHGEAHRRAAELGVRRIDVSPTHPATQAMAKVVFSGDGGEEAG